MLLGLIAGMGGNIAKSLIGLSAMRLGITDLNNQRCFNM